MLEVLGNYQYNIKYTMRINCEVTVNLLENRMYCVIRQLIQLIRDQTFKIYSQHRDGSSEPSQKAMHMNLNHHLV